MEGKRGRMGMGEKGGRKAAGDRKRRKRGEGDKV
jgi:hypothetical protein